MMNRYDGGKTQKRNDHMIDTYIALDLETTGLSPSMDRILEIGAVKVVNGQILETYETLVNPERKIEKRIEELTGITDEMEHCFPGWSTEAFRLSAAIIIFNRRKPIGRHMMHWQPWNCMGECKSNF